MFMYRRSGKFRVIFVAIINNENITMKISRFTVVSLHMYYTQCVIHPCLQCPPQAKGEVHWEDEAWVGSITASNLLALPHFCTKELAYGANMP